MKILAGLAGMAGTIYLVLVSGIYIFQDRIIFQGVKLPEGHEFSFTKHHREYFVRTEDGNKLNGLLFKTSLPPQGLIIYFHGNSGNLARWGRYAEDFTINGFDILMIDFRGYGKSTGSPTENSLYGDAKAVWHWAQNQFQYTNYVIYGRSLGAAIATDLAASVQPRLLILETPFDEFNGVLPRLFKPVYQLIPLKYTFSNTSKLPQVQCKIVIFQGTRDQIVPYSSAIKLKPHLKEKDLFITIPEGKHHDLRKFDLFHEKLSEALDF